MISSIYILLLNTYHLLWICLLPSGYVIKEESPFYHIDYIYAYYVMYLVVWVEHKV